MDRSVFFRHVRASLFAGRLTGGQVAGITAILDRADLARAEPGLAEPGLAQTGQAGLSDGGCDPRWLAYMLATAHHETGRKMQAIRETGAATDDEAIARLDAAFRRGRLPSVRRPYWRRDAKGRTWLGRGLVQLTHRRNYETMTRLTGVDLVADPARALDGAVAVEILFTGMITGAFTGCGLGRFFHASGTDWVGARRIINGRDRAGDIAAIALLYHAALLAARRKTEDLQGEDLRTGERSLCP